MVSLRMGDITSNLAPSQFFSLFCFESELFVTKQHSFFTVNIFVHRDGAVAGVIITGTFTRTFAGTFARTFTGTFAETIFE